MNMLRRFRVSASCFGLAAVLAVGFTGCNRGGDDATAEAPQDGVVRYAGQEIAITGSVTLTASVAARKAADPSSEVVGSVPAGSAVTQKAQFSTFTLVSWNENGTEKNGWIQTETVAAAAVTGKAPVLINPIKPKPTVDPVQQCTGGKVFDKAANACACPNTTAWDGSNCTVAAAQKCTGGKVLDAATNSCKCPPSTGWNGTQCVDAVAQCTGGKVLDAATKTCKCPASTAWDGSQCLSPAQQCTGGKVLDAATKTCKCPAATAWNGSSCVAPAQQCTGGKVLDAATKTCKCPAASAWNGSSCVAAAQTCAGGKVFDAASNSCKCPTSSSWDGAKCVTIKTPIAPK
jgi:hypothetical protein